MRRDLHVVTDNLMPCYLTIQGNRLNVITKKVTSWAAIIAVPTFITGFYGMNVPYPGFSRQAGFAAAIAVMVIAGLVLYVVFRRKGWL
jgi:magnesium transporter